MNQYMIALKGGFDHWSSRPQAEKEEAMTHFSSWVKGLMDKGHYQNCVRPEEGENRRLTLANGKVVVDGPFPETKELISGAFFIKARNLFEATELAKNCPVLNYGGSIEVFALTDNRIS